MTPAAIIHAVADAHGVRVYDVRGPFRNPSLTLPRHEAMWLLRKLTELSYPDIGRLFCRHHTSVMHGVERIGVMCMLDESYEARLLAVVAPLVSPSLVELAKAFFGEKRTA